MIEFVYGYDSEVIDFISQISPPPDGSTFGRCKTIGVLNDGQLIAGMVFFHFNPAAETIEIGAAAISPRWFTRATYRRMFEYPFVECGCQMVYTKVRADNERLLSEFARMDFNLTIIPRMYGRDEDGVLCTLTDDQWLSSRLAERMYRDVRRKKEAA